MSTRSRPAGKPAKAISRRRFVSLLAASAGAVMARPAAGAPAPRAKKPAPSPAPAPPSAEQKEFERQRANTLSALKTLREYKLPPGGDLSIVFRPLPTPPRRSR